MVLSPGDLLIGNDTKVLPARVAARKAGSGGRVDLLFVRPHSDTEWSVLAKGRLPVGQVLELTDEARAVIIRRNAEETVVRVESRKPVREVMESIGRMPLPPYIKREPEAADREWYQTSYAAAEGAIAAPTAGLHLTASIRRQLAARGIDWATVTLHVGLGTFKPVTAEAIEQHTMDAEWATVSAETAALVRRAKAEGRRIIAVGTTSVRTLESSLDESGQVTARTGETRLYITPGYRFRAVDGMLTNFHFPKTTLLMLVSALAGVEPMREAYRTAVQERYRFYSYGDAMLIL